MAIHDEVVVEASKEMELVDPPLILSSSTRIEDFDGPIRKIEKKSGDTVVEEDESGDSDEDMEDDKEIGGSSDEEDDEGEDHDELGEFGDYEDNEVYDEMGITCAGVEVASSEGLHARVTNCTHLFLFYSLQHMLLQPEEELLALRSSIPLIKGSSHKSKKAIGRVNVQVKMDLDSPKGCSFSSLHPSKIKEEALRCFLSNLRSTSSSGVRQGILSLETLIYVNFILIIKSQIYTCIFRPKSSNDDKPVRMQLGSGQTHLFPGKYCGCVVAQIDTFIEELGAKVRWFPIYHDPEHELVGRMHLFIKYNIDESVAETVAYDFVLEVATKAQHFQQRNLVLHGERKWLLTEFASCYGISDGYARLSDYDQNRILGEIEGQLEQILSLAFENYKALDESSLSGLMDDFWPGTGSPVLALAPAIKLYNRLHDIISPDTQLKICRYFQFAAKKRSRRHLAETDEFVTSNGEGTLMDVVTLSSSYQKMKSVCIHLLDISSAIYTMDVCTRLRAFLVACRPESPSSPVRELVIATDVFQKDFIKLFHPYIISWIHHKPMSLLDACKLGVRTQHSAVSFVDYMYERLEETLSEYEFIFCRWPEYTFVLETAIADAEKALVVALEKQYEDVLSPFKENLAHKFGLKHVQKLARRSACIYEVPKEVTVVLLRLEYCVLSYGFQP
ncbi:hypothetical protein MKX03_017295 [Papaver bracteatum]|nr:hypothetical protein MKX03_017295 [Papaver bracteatum]